MKANRMLNGESINQKTNVFQHTMPADQAKIGKMDFVVIAAMLI
jgi:hypothetical protein